MIFAVLFRQDAGKISEVSKDLRNFYRVMLFREREFRGFGFADGVFGGDRPLIRPRR